MKSGNILFFDPLITGHHTEYISHLIDAVKSNSKEDKKFIFVVHPNFEEKFPQIAAKFKGQEMAELILLSDSEHEKCLKGGILRVSLKQYSVVNRYSKKFSADHVFLLQFNVFQLSLTLFRPPYKVSGILFQQFNRMDRTGLINKIRFYRKYIQTFFFTKNKSIQNVFVLNDEQSVEVLNRWFSTGIFKVLPDPVPDIVADRNFNIREVYHIPSDRTIFLHFGTLSDIKGTLELLESVRYMEAGLRKRVALLVVGKASPNFDEKIKRRIQEIESCYSDMVVRYDNRFVTDGQMKSMFNQCDAVAIPYKVNEASSGVFGHAMASSKPLLGVNKGLIGEMIDKYSAGVLINESDNRLIAQGIQEMIEKKPNNFQYHVDVNTCDKFSKKVLEV